MPRKLYLETFGCQMNVLDSELVLGQLHAQGYESTADREQADVILYNTCSVREPASLSCNSTKIVRNCALSLAKRCEHQQLIIG